MARTTESLQTPDVAPVSIEAAPIVAGARVDRRGREQTLYVIVGAWNTAFGYVVWAILQATLGGWLPYALVLLLAWPIAVLNAYFTHRTFVFRSHEPIRAELPRFSLVYVATLAANLVVLPLALAALPLSVYAIQALFTIAVVALSYVAHKYYSFGRRRTGDVGDGSP
ncbi:MAG TPA: GtrA family protein [Propionicimonas sp.]|jgi:putative flippase GtrA